MPGYGIAGAGEGAGLLPWAWAEERLLLSHNYWVATVWPDGRPHAMPVWGIWEAWALWFSSGGDSRKSRNLRADARCVITTENAAEPVVIEGSASIVTDTKSLAMFLQLMNEKYERDMSMDFLDPAVNATFRVRPRFAFSLTEKEFTSTPTRWDRAGLNDDGEEDRVES